MGVSLAQAYDEIKMRYSKKDAAEVIRTETCYGKKPEGYDEVYVFVPSKNEIIRIAEGSGDNLLMEDIDEGYVDYIYYEQYRLDGGIAETDGGEVLLKELFQEKYECTADCIPAVLDMAYGSELIDCMILV